MERADWLAEKVDSADVLHEHQAAAMPARKSPRPRGRYRGVFGAPAW